MDVEITEQDLIRPFGRAHVGHGLAPTDFGKFDTDGTAARCAGQQELAIGAAEHTPPGQTHTDRAGGRE